MPDEENTQPTPEPTTTEAPVSFNEAQDKQQADSAPSNIPSEVTEAPASPEDPSTVKDQNPAPPSLEASAGQGNEPFDSAPDDAKAMPDK